MKISDLVSKFFNNSDKSKSFKFTSSALDGGYFSVDKILFEKIKKGQANDWLTQQLISLRMLEEQGEATAIPNGFKVSAEVLSRLDNNTRDMLSLPEVWPGKIIANIKGTSSRSSFHVDLSVTDPNDKETHSYQIEGAIIKFGESAKFLLSQPQLMAFTASMSHQSSEKSEFDNLAYLHNLQLSQKAGAEIKLSHFDNLIIHTPEKIAVEAEINDKGDLILTPYMGQKASHDDVQNVLGQLMSPNANTLKVGNEIILFTEEKIKAVNEILNNHVISKENVKEFLEKPTAFINASLVDLELGFSVRVHGATTFKHAYFGETDDTGIDWFGKTIQVEKVFPFSKLSNEVKDIATLSQIEDIVSDASQTGATEINFEDNTYDISDIEQVNKTLKKIRDKIVNNPDAPDEPSEPISPNDPPNDPPKKPNEQIVVDIDLNDEVLSENSALVASKIDDVCYKDELNWNNYIRTPFKHQDIGVRWILGLIKKSQQAQHIKGALLADDMGLGKTFMALSAVEHHFQELKHNDKTQKPTLIVAPLSLLENWQDEVFKTFSESPFSDIVILQSDGELSRFKNGGVEIKSPANADGELEPKYSLNVGKGHSDRLDMPGRLVITTYQTLRDYQFSLCLIDWGMVIFDEAQNIKNPNALQTRAAKGLKADFTLVATGTPVENSLADFWCLMDTACPEYLGSYQDFREKYITPILQAAGDEIEDIRSRIGRELRIQVGSLMLRRVKEDNLEGLPEKLMYVGIEDEQWKYLPELAKTMSGYQLEVYDGAIESLDDSESNQALATLQRLRSASLHPMLADGGSLEGAANNTKMDAIFAESQKLKSLLITLDNIKKRQEKCIIFAVNKQLQKFLSAALSKKYSLDLISVINGDLKAVSKKSTTPTRKSLITQFEAKKGFNIIIMSPVAAGVGLTVVGANNVIHLERHWNPAKEAQATDRVYRIGQTKDVNIYIPVLLHPEMESFDVNLHRLLSKKTQLKDAVVTPEEVFPMPDGVASKGSFTDETPITAKVINKLSWQQFEALSVEIMSKEAKADSAWLASNGPDKGSDGILVKDDHLILIQSKHTKSGRYDGYKAIQEIVGAKPVYESELGKSDSKLYFITNATALSKRTRLVAKQCNVEIINGADLASLVNKHKISFKQILTRLDKKRLSV